MAWLLGGCAASTSTENIDAVPDEAPVALSSTAVDFGPLDIHEVPETLVVTATNGGNPAMITPTLVGDGFSIGNNGCTSIVPKHGSCDVEVSFDPSMIQGYSGHLELSTPGFLPVIATLEGKGAAKISAAISGAGILSGDFVCSNPFVDVSVSCGEALFTDPNIEVIATPSTIQSTELDGWLTGVCQGTVGPVCSFDVNQQADFLDGTVTSLFILVGFAQTS